MLVYVHQVLTHFSVKFRSGNHGLNDGLNEELGRHGGREGRKECLLCDDEWESVRYFLWEVYSTYSINDFMSKL